MIFLYITVCSAVIVTEICHETTTIFYDVPTQESPSELVLSSVALESQQATVSQVPENMENKPSYLGLLLVCAPLFIALH